ncbi:mitochondrial cardiolipin hydrolase-like [Drosophila hydei]|uniref:Mitochondrial cardiolipin hydrolase n=1 Tax=Drosophila hydei TaxID=7224 RepID=A0A6J1LBJ8_DROHY|nr:mitochondrial cardiolipin hydrolase-like [Drosophila hydei]
MLYYLIKFLKLCCSEPFQLAAHYARLKREWANDRIGKSVNQAAFISYQYFRNCFVLHQTPVSKCEDTSCIWRQLEHIIEHMDRAQYSIDIAIYVMDSYAIGDALRRASQRGVRVRLICYKSYQMLQNKYGDCIWLRRLSPLSRQPREMTMHHKFCVIDGYMAKRAQKSPALTVCMTGSMNWISLPRSCDDFLITSSPRIAKRLEQEFERIWSLCKARENAPHVKHLQ